VPNKDGSPTRYDRYQDRQFEKFKRKVYKRIPDLANRIFALRNRLYSGCGFSYELDQHLGELIKCTAANYWPKENTYHSGFIAVELLAKCLFQEVAEIEKELKLKDNP
jgi:hypothetical protein